MERVLFSVIFFAALTLPVLGFGGEAESFTLKAGGLQIEFDLARKGGITSLRNGEVDVVAPGWEAPTLFRIAYVQRQRVMEYRSLDFDRFEYEKLPLGIRFHHTGLKDQEIEVISTVESKGDYISFTSEVNSIRGIASSTAFPSRFPSRSASAKVWACTQCLGLWFPAGPV